MLVIVSRKCMFGMRWKWVSTIQKFWKYLGHTQFRGDLNLTVHVLYIHVLCVPVLYITKYACVVVCVLL